MNADLFIAHNAVPEGATGIERRLHMPPSVIGQIADSAHVKSLVLSHRMLRTLGKETETQAEIRKRYSGPIDVCKRSRLLPSEVSCAVTMSYSNTTCHRRLHAPNSPVARIRKSLPAQRILWWHQKSRYLSEFSFWSNRQWHSHVKFAARNPAFHFVAPFPRSVHEKTAPLTLDFAYARVYEKGSGASYRPATRPLTTFKKRA